MMHQEAWSEAALKTDAASRRLADVFAQTLILLTAERAHAKLNDDQAARVIHLVDISFESAKGISWPLTIS